MKDAIKCNHIQEINENVQGNTKGCEEYEKLVLIEYIYAYA